jgi:D-xylose transport system permease protein
MKGAAPAVTAGERTKRLARETRTVKVGSIIRTYGLIAILVLLAVLFHVLSGGLFVTERNLPNLLQQASITMVVAMGVSLVIVARHIDLSIGSAAGLCAIVAAYAMNELDLPVVVALGGALLVGLLMGLVQGSAVTFLGVPSFVVTLAGLLVFRGIGLVLTEGNTIAAFPASFRVIGQGSIGFGVAVPALVVAAACYVVYRLVLAQRAVDLRDWTELLHLVALLVLGGAVLFLARSPAGLPTPVLIVALIGAVLGILAYRTRFGRHLFAVGGNPMAAELAGIAVKRTTLKVFLLMGALYALAGVMLAARLNGAPPEGAPNLELDAIAGAVIGGTSLMGGTGSVGGAMLGALLMASVSNGLSLLGVQSFYQLIATGVILVLAVTLDVKLRARGDASRSHPS